MALYIKRPIPMEASQWNKDGDHPNVSMLHETTIPADQICQHCGKPMGEHGWIGTLEGGHRGGEIVCPSDWIATGVQGEHWPIKDSIFVTTYKLYEPAKVGDFRDHLSTLWARVRLVLSAIGANNHLL